MKRFSAPYLYLALVLPFGLALLLINPPAQAPDENFHFFRVFQLAEGQWIATKKGQDLGGYVPQIVSNAASTEGISFYPQVKMTKEIFWKKLSPVFVDWGGNLERTFERFTTVALYSPLSYPAQLIAVFLGKLAGLGPLLLLYGARFFGFAATISLCALALRLAPSWQWTWMVCLLSPMTLYLSGSVALDGTLIGATFLLAALVAKSYLEPKFRSHPATMAAVIVLALYVALSKFVYVPLALSLSFFYCVAFPSARSRIAIGVALLSVCLLPSLIWGVAASKNMAPIRTDIPVDPHAQIQFIFDHPIAFAKLLIRTARFRGGEIYRWFVGTLGWLDTPLPSFFYGAFGLGLLGCFFSESKEKSFPVWLRVFALGSAVSIVLMFFVLSFINNNPPGPLMTIEGVQGRYLIPLVPLALWGFSGWGWKKPDLSLAISTGVSIGSGVVCLWAVVARFYS